MLFYLKWIADEREGKGGEGRGGKGGKERQINLFFLTETTVRRAIEDTGHLSDFKIRQNVWTVFYFNILNHAANNYFTPGTNP